MTDNDRWPPTKEHPEGKPKTPRPPPMQTDTENRGGGGSFDMLGPGLVVAVILIALAALVLRLNELGVL